MVSLKILNLYFIQRKPDGRPKYSLFVPILIVLIALASLSGFILAKVVLKYSDLHEEAGWFAVNFIWPPALAFLTSTLHCYVYCESLTIARKFVPSHNEEDAINE